jgi:hypothetical protein
MTPARSWSTGMCCRCCPSIPTTPTACSDNVGRVVADCCQV